MDVGSLSRFSPASSRLHLGFISAASRLHLGFISASSRLHLAHEKSAVSASDVKPAAFARSSTSLSSTRSRL